ncbi:nucleotidyl transferase AbiEii/AbiGii toxin family protein [Pannonibacter indicus]|uniref:nucleotidyl transferase AbiEii/AbiGii toxin family protein n=1 Tax=Pannonibacter indicus TaxID=466044 RepID=UPI0035AE6C01
MARFFKRPHHQAILTALHGLNGELMHRAQCFFGGGTAIVLQLGEYRESVDIDFLCASQEGYRLIRQTVFGAGLAGLIRPEAEITPLREVKTDQYGIRTAFECGGAQIKFEIIREARVTLNGAFDPDLRVPVLARTDLYLEKLLANADRWADRAVLSRDIIDLSMMISSWGEIPAAAWTRAREAYGDTAGQAYAQAVELIRDPEYLRHCMERMAMSATFADTILAPHGGPLPKAR